MIQHMTSPPKTGILLGLDVGNVWVGVAKSDLRQEIVWPMCTVRNNLFEPWMQQLQFQPVGIVVGWPLLMNDDEGPQCKSVERFISRLRNVYQGHIIKHDERLTTHHCQRLYGSDDDSFAAMVILQGFLETNQE